MKVIYNNKEIMNNTNNYETLLNLPMINSAELRGVKTLNNINAYSKLQVDELIGNSRAIEIVATLPTNLIENTLYYVGPDANDFYDVYLVDEVRNVINIGTSQFGEYFAGTGIEIDSDNYIHAKIDNKTIIVDSEGNLHANLELDSVPVMVGATSSANGEKGLVPQPQIGDNLKFLTGNATWKSFIDVVYPVGSVYLTYDNSRTPNDMFLGTTWTKLTTGRVLWTANSSTQNNLGAQLPAVYGKIELTMQVASGDTIWGGAFTRTNTSGIPGPQPGELWRDYPWGNATYDFTASKGTYKTDGTTKMTESESPYGKSNTVQAKTIAICAWQRTA